MLSLTLVVALATGVPPGTNDDPAHVIRERVATTHPIQPDYIPEWTRMGFDGGTVTAITRFHGDQLWAAGLFGPFSESGLQTPFGVASGSLGADWTALRDEDAWVVNPFSERMKPATASDGSPLVFTYWQAWILNTDTAQWVRPSRPAGLEFNPMINVDVGRGQPAFALLGFGPRVMGGVETPPGLVALDVPQALMTDVTPVQAAGLPPVAVAISTANGVTWAAAFEVPGASDLIVRTQDGGQTWSTLPPLPTGPVSALSWQGERLLVAVDGVGVLAYDDDAWRRIDRGSARLRSVRVLEVSPHDARLVFAAGREGLSRSQDAGESWEHRLAGTPGHHVETVYVDPVDPDLVYLGVLGEGVLASDDGGASFFPASRGIFGVSVLDVTSNHANPRHLAVLQVREDGVRLRESFDAGTSWDRALATPAEPRKLAFGADGVLWMLGRQAGDASNMGLYRRTGTGWTRALLPTPAPGNVQLEFIQPGAAPGTLYAGGGGTSGAIAGSGLAWRSEDGGHSWSLLWTEPGPAGQLYIADALVEMPGFDGQELIIDRSDRADQSLAAPVMRRSSDAGAHWTPLVLQGGADWTVDRWLCADPERLGRLVSVDSFIRGNFTEHYLDSGVGWQPIEGHVPRGPKSFSCWFSEGKMRYLAGVAADERIFYGEEGSNGRHAPLISDWPNRNFSAAREVSVVHRWEGGLLVGTASGLWSAPLEEVPPAPVLLSATDTGARMAPRVRLNWTGGATWVRILRNGEEIAFIPNAGEWSGRVLRDNGAPARYAVCNGFDENCSESGEAGR